MDPRVAITYKKILIDIDFSKPLSVYDVIRVIHYIDPYINQNNEYILNLIKECDKNYPPINVYFSRMVKNIIVYFKQSLGISPKKIIPKTNLMFWRVRGWSDKESEFKQREFLKSHIESQKDIYNKFTAIKYYSSKGIKIPDTHVRDAVITLVRNRLPYIKQNSSTETKLVDDILRQWPTGYPPRNVIEREVKKLTFGSLSGSSIEYYERMGWSHDEAILNVTNIQKKRSPRCIDYWISKGYSKIDAIDQVSLYQKSNSTQNKEYWMIRYDMNEIDANILADNSRKNRKYLLKSTIDYWKIRGHNDVESHKLQHDYIASIKNNNPTTIEYWINLGYSYDDALFHKKSLNPMCVEYWIKNGYNNDDALKKTRESNHLCIEYWRTICDSEESAQSEFLKHQLSLYNKMKHTSKLATEFCELLRSCFPDNNIVFFGDSNEFSIYSSDKKCIRFYDYTDITLKIIVEFNGRYYHSTDYQKSNDEFKKELAISKGFKIYYVWDDDFIHNKSECVIKLYEQIIGDISNENCKD